jgi:ATP/maltotriose-dependent transcriptional regulator MalT/DNA-binding SARP family transcriptional activator
MLEILDRQNLFLSRLEGGVASYRYHALFGDFLRKRLRAVEPEEYARLQMRAGALAEAEGDVDDAVSHYLRGGDPERAADLVERVAGETIVAGRVHSLLRWCGLLPEDLAADRCRLQIQRARAAYEARDLELMRRALTLAEDASRRSGDPRLIAETLIWRSLAQRARGHFTQAIEECRAGLAMAEDLEDAELIALALKQLGLTLYDVRSPLDAIRALDRALEYYVRLGDEFNQGMICHHLGSSWKHAGQPDRARSCLERAADHWRRIGNAGMLAMTLVVRGNLSYERGLLDDATATLAEARRQAQESGYLRIEGYATESLGDVARDRGDLVGARAAYESALAIAEKVGEVRLKVEALDALARAQLYEGNLDGALATVCRARAIAVERDSAFERGLCETTYGVILAELGQIADGAEALTTAREWLQSSSSVRDLARARLHRAALAARAGARAADLEDAREALSWLVGPLDPFLAAEARYLLPILRAVEGSGPPWVKLITQRLEREDAARDHRRDVPRLRLVTNHRVRSFSLGRSEVEIDGHLLDPADWVSLRARDLWFYLLAFGPAPKEQIVEALWPEMPPENGLNAFHQTLHRLRRSLFPECVARVGQRWRIPESVDSWCDDREFERLAAEDRLDPGRSDEGSPLLRAVELYRGIYLPDLDADWVIGRRGRLQTTWLRLLRGAIDRARAEDDPKRVVFYAEQYLDVDPDDEDVHEALMRGHVASGNARAAVRHFQQYARQVREELDAEPARRLVLLAQQLSRGR